MLHLCLLKGKQEDKEEVVQHFIVHLFKTSIIKTIVFWVVFFERAFLTYKLYKILIAYL